MYEPKIGETVWFLYNYGDGDDEALDGIVIDTVAEDKRYPHYRIRDPVEEEYLVFSECIYKTKIDLLKIKLEELYRERISLNNKIGYMETQINNLHE